MNNLSGDKVMPFDRFLTHTYLDANVLYLYLDHKIVNVNRADR